MRSNVTNLDFLMMKMTSLGRKVWMVMWKVGKEDPRRVIHSLKFGLSLSLVSLLFLLEPLFAGIGKNAIWAVMTVVVVFEFTAGATLCKGFNRGLGTLSAGSLAFLVEFVANKSGRIYRAVFIGTSVFLIGSVATYLRFFPYVKKNYDYGVLIFVLTFNLITVSSYRVENVLRIAHERFYTIAIGCGICLVMSLLIFPNWSGEHLHDSAVFKLKGLANSIEACVKKYFEDAEADTTNDQTSEEDPIYKGYKAVLDSKSTDETLALYASWEPRHSIHCYKFPGKQYVKLGTVLRHFGYTAIALHGCLETEIQTPRSIRAVFKRPCTRVAEEVTKVLMKLADSIKNRQRFSRIFLSDNLKEALQELDNTIKSQPRLFLGSNEGRVGGFNTPVGSNEATPRKQDASSTWAINKLVAGNERKVLKPSLSKIAITGLEFSEALPFAAFASLLVEMVARLDLVIEQVEELGRLANFKELKSDDMEVVVAQNSMQISPSEIEVPNLSSHGPE